MDEATLEIISVVTNTNDVSDADALPDLLQDVPGEIEQVSADDTYDQRKCYDTLYLPKPLCVYVKTSDVMLLS